VHGWLLHRRTHTPIRTLAKEIGISKTAVDYFEKRQHAPKRTWPKLRDWYVRSRQQKPQREEYQTAPEDVLIAAELMLDGVPLSRRPAAVRATARHFRDLYAEMKLPIPAWIDRLDQSADETERPRRRTDAMGWVDEG